MIILGLGSNLGDRLKHLRRAYEALKNHPAITIKQVSPIYKSDALLPENAPTSWNQMYFNLAIACETTLSPHELLAVLKQIEKKCGRTPEKEWGPRIIDIDILAWDDRVIREDHLHIPHENLHERPFALWPLADLTPQWIYPASGDAHGKTAAEIAGIWGSRFSGAAPLHTQQILHRIDTPQLIGILNITPDSFSGEGSLAQEKVLQQALHFIVSGAEILDLGAEATNPNATPIDAETEWQRLQPILTFIKNNAEKFFIPPKISIDTRHPETAAKALACGADWINDVSGLENPAMCALIKEARCKTVFMHHLGIPARADYSFPATTSAVAEVLQFAEQRLAALEKQGIAHENLIFDVGIGFGKNAEQSLALIQEIDQFRHLPVPLLVGHSRKRFFEMLTDKKAHERDLETTLLSLHLAKHQVDYLRVHHVEMHARAFRMMHATV